MIIVTTVDHRGWRENFKFRDWTPFCVQLEVSSPHSPRGMFHGWHTLELQVWQWLIEFIQLFWVASSSSSSKGSLSGGKHKPNETNPPLHSDVALDTTFHNINTCVLSRNSLYTTHGVRQGHAMDYVKYHMGSQWGEWNLLLFLMDWKKEKIKLS